MVELQLDFDRALDDWTINGSPGDCVEAIARGREMGLENIGVTIYSLPAEPQARSGVLELQRTTGDATRSPDSSR